MSHHGMTDYQSYITELNPEEAAKVLWKLLPVGDSGVGVGLELWPEDNQSIQLRLYDEHNKSIALAVLDCHPLGPLFGSRLKLEIHDRDSLAAAMAWFEAAERALPAVEPEQEQESEPWWWDDVQDPKHRRFIELWLKTKGDVPAMAESLGMSKYRVRRTSSTLRKRYGERVVPLKRRF